MIRLLLENARRRMLYNQLAAQFIFAASLVLGAVILLLLIGTQLLDWRILGFLVVCGAVFGLVRTLRGLPTLYQVAMLVDRRAGLFDALSTAWIFEEGKGAVKAEPEISACQREQAEHLAHGVDLEHALPFTMPRAAYAMAGLFLVASSLFALRYGIARNLDLKAPLSAVVMDALGWNPPASAEKAKHPAESKMASLLKQLGITAPEPGEKIQPQNLDAATDSALESIADLSAENGMAKNLPGGKTEEASVGKDGEASSDPEENAANDQGTPGKGNPEDAMGSQEGPQQGEQQASKSGSAGENSSLLSKLKDAMNNLMSKSKSPQGQGQKPDGQKSQAQGAGEKADKGQQGQGKQDGAKDSADAAQDGQQQGDNDSAQNSPGKGGGKNNDKDLAAQAGSGIGKQDGSKDVRAAQQEKAMGKLSEVIGKRSANVTGEMTVEVQSGSQQLKTAYTQKNAQHAEGGGEASRDEVPLDLQPYVSGYFEEVRKSAAASTGSAAKK